MIEQSNKSKTLVNVVMLAVVAGVFALAAWSFFSRYDRFSQENLRSFVQSFGAWAPLAYAALYIASAPIPFLAPVLSAAGGLLFGALLGTLYILIIATLSAFVPFVMARRLGRDWVEGKLKGRKLDEVYQQSAGGKGFVFILLMRLIPVLPWEVQNYVAGVTKVNPLTFAAGTIVGIIPGSFSLAFLGASVTEPGSWQFWLAIALKVVTAAVPLAYTLLRARAKKRAAAPQASSDAS